MLKYSFINNTVNNISIQLNNDIDFVNNIEFNNEIELIDNLVIDQEINVYKLSNQINMSFDFYKDKNYGNTFLNTGFTQNEITLSNKNYRFSYILMQVFSSMDIRTRNLLHNSYIPIYLFPSTSNTNFEIIPSNKYYEFNNIYISNVVKLIEDQSLYCEFKFYNGKTGKLNILFNKAKNTNKEDRFYFEIKINIANKTYQFINNNINAREFINEEYTNKINDLNKLENKTPNYPTGDLFSVNGEYLNINI